MITIDPRISAIASGIAAAISEVQVGLFESRARGTAQPDAESLRKGPEKLDPFEGRSGFLQPRPRDVDGLAGKIGRRCQPI